MVVGSWSPLAQFYLCVSPRQKVSLLFFWKRSNPVICGPTHWILLYKIYAEYVKLKALPLVLCKTSHNIVGSVPRATAADCLESSYFKEKPHRTFTLCSSFLLLYKGMRLVHVLPHCLGCNPFPFLPFGSFHPLFFLLYLTSLYTGCIMNWL